MHRRVAWAWCSALGLGALMLSTPLQATDCCDPASPFREGEGWAEQPATCENIGYWADRAPTTDARISLAIKGRLHKVDGGVLAYLEMCSPKGVQVVCVTYETNGMKPGDVVEFGGGYRRSGPKQVVLDPCLAASAE